VAIKESLNRGMPLISFGIQGPPEAGIVTGYEQDGAVLCGWSYFQPDGSQYYQSSNWFETMESAHESSPGSRAQLIVIDGRKPTAPTDEMVLVSSLEWALDLERTSNRPEIPDHACGLAAFDAWASSLEVDSDYPPDNSAVMEFRVMMYSDFPCACFLPPWSPRANTASGISTLRAASRRTTSSGCTWGSVGDRHGGKRTSLSVRFYVSDANSALRSCLNYN
jgi:hypothetical protein